MFLVVGPAVMRDFFSRKDAREQGRKALIIGELLILIEIPILWQAIKLHFHWSSDNRKKDLALPANKLSIN